MKIEQLYEIVCELRKKCPWDREQTHISLLPHLIEEAYEIVDAIEQKNDNELKEELGDVLLQVVFHALLAEERKVFTLENVIEDINEKLIRRHPHVFADKQADDEYEALVNWEAAKTKEKDRTSVLDGIPKSLPGLQKAMKTQARAARVGFDWDNARPVYDKIEEEWQELQKAITEQKQTDIEHEFGDMLFSLVNLARHLKIDPEYCLRKTINKFENRFKYIEHTLAHKGETLTETPLVKMEQLWQEAKQHE